MSDRSGSTLQNAAEPPTDDDIQRTSQLESFLVEAGVYETEEGNIKRQEAISEIERICKEWVKQLTRQKGYADQMVEEANAVIFTCGSYRLQVHEPGSDLDLLCVGPSYVNREKDFFMVLGYLLAQNEVSELQPLPDAHVPVMAFKFHGISTNLFYASVSLLAIPQDLDISQQSVLYYIDEATMRCLNERRAADMILDLVPDVMSFQTTLICLKYWAKRRGVYSKVMGFLEDVSLAVLVAHVCQLYPYAIPSILVSRFFCVYAEWLWPHPVVLCAIEDNEELGFTVWSQNSPGDTMHWMPIITPAYPCMNSSKEVSLGTLHVMIEQFDCANEICQKIELNDATWSALFEPYQFFENAAEPPTDDDIQRTSQLESFLVEAGVYETEEGNIKRLEVISEIERICNEWVKQLTHQKGCTDQMVEDANAVIFTCGSYRLQVHEPGSDLDLLCVGPSYVNREKDFFMVLCNLLAQNEEVSELQPLPDAHVPVMAFKFCGISTNLFYASVFLLAIPQDLDISQQSLFYNIDEATVRCLNECRMADMILGFVPDVMSFQTTLRCLKYWAKRRGIYSSVMGYLGDVSLAVLVAHVCQLYPNAVPSMLVSRFFCVYALWQWPKPVMLLKVEDNEELGFTVWDPQNFHEGTMHWMPIITPVYPCTNSSEEVSLSTLRFMIEQFIHAMKICQNVELNKATWSTLFEPYKFFKAYKNYLQVEVVAANVKDHLGWERWVKSRLIRLTLQFEGDNYCMLQCHLYPCKFTDPTSQVPHCAFFIGLSSAKWLIKHKASCLFNVSTIIDKFRLDVNKYAGWNPRMDVYIRHHRRKHLPSFVLLPL